MNWFFDRGRDHLRVETRYDHKLGEFVLILHQADGTQLVDRFKSETKLRKRLQELERKLTRARWRSRQREPEVAGPSARNAR